MTSTNTKSKEGEVDISYPALIPQCDERQLLEDFTEIYFNAAEVQVNDAQQEVAAA